MAKILDMPKLSPTMEEGRLALWHKAEGDSFGVDDLLAEVETDKATMEFRAFDKGTLLKILVPAGSMVVLGQPVAIVGQPGEDPNSVNIGGTVTTADNPPARAANSTASAETLAPETRSSAIVAEEPAKISDGRLKASPYVRKLAREQGFDLAHVSGSGPHGRIIARDLATLESAPVAEPVKRPESSPSTTTQSTTPANSAGLAQPTAKPLSPMRKAIARRLTESKQTVPHFYLTVDLDADALVDLRSKIMADLEKLGEPHKVSLNDLLVKACALALRRVPACNAQYSPDAILIHQRVDISVAVAVDDGLMTPVVRNADQKGVLAIAQEIRELAGRAKTRKLKPEEMSNGTFSISNLGMFGVDSFAAVINPPEGAILAVGQVRREPVVKGETLAIGHRLACTLSCDHRVVDGAIGATFLRELRALVEHPSRLLL